MRPAPGCMLLLAIVVILVALVVGLSNILTLIGLHPSGEATPVLSSPTPTITSIVDPNHLTPEPSKQPVLLTPQSSQ